MIDEEKKLPFEGILARFWASKKIEELQVIPETFMNDKQLYPETDEIKKQITEVGKKFK